MRYIDVHTHQAEREGIQSIQNIEVGRGLSISQNSFYSAGIHPWYINDLDNQFEEFGRLANHKNCLAIGECGLDKSIELPFTKQQDIFIRQVQYSEESKKPLIIHCVRAYEEIIQIRKDLKPLMPWIFHGFNKGIQLANRIFSNDCYISISQKFIELPKSNELIQKLDLAKLFLETDDSKGKIEEAYQLFCEKRKLSLEKLQEQVEQNFKHVFL